MFIKKLLKNNYLNKNKWYEKEKLQKKKKGRNGHKNGFGKEDFLGVLEDWDKWFKYFISYNTLDIKNINHKILSCHFL